jgi:hypothetical protein
MPVILATREAEFRSLMVQSQPGQIVREALPQKTSTQKRAGKVVQVVECLTSKCGALSSSPTTTKNKNWEEAVQWLSQQNQ